MFKLNPLLLSLLAAQGLMLSATPVSAVVLNPFTPERNDNKVGAYCLCNGSTQTLSGVPRFNAGESGMSSVTLGELQKVGRIINDNLIGEPRLQLGAQNYAIGIPDEETGSYRVYQVYNSAEMISPAEINGATVVPDYYDVNDKQYIDARVATVTNGRLNINIGQQGAAANASTNRWSMAAKQSQLFASSNNGQINWDSNNRIRFTAATPPYGGDRLAFDAGGVVTYAGLFDVTLKDGSSNAYYVSNLNELRNYNDWLIDQISGGNLSPESYNAALNHAFSLRDGRVVYRMSTGNYDDEVAAALGDQVVLSADGAKARVKINRGKTLEVANSASAVMRASNGATAIIAGKLATSNAPSSEAGALELISGARGINNGVINSGFFNAANGRGVAEDSLGYAGTAVSAIYDSEFRNNGVLNVHIGDAPWGTAGLFLGSSSAVNHGNINLGIHDVANGSSAAAVSFSGEGSFVNARDGTIYLGRTPQNHKGDVTQDVAVSLGGGISAISGLLDSRAINDGRIVIGSKVENAVGMRIEAGPNAVSLNNGVIDVNGMAQALPRENIAMLAIDSGSGGQVGNRGTLNLNGYNSTGLKVIATAGNQAHAFSSGAINVAGDADRFGGTNNTAVWVTGEPGGHASADITGPIRLSGKAGIGIRAEGQATVNVSARAIPASSGSDSMLDSGQISFYRIGPDARINLPANGRYSASVWNGTIFRVEQGADFDGRGLTLSMNSPFATGVYGSGAGTDINTHGATLNIASFASGLTITDGARATIDAATRIHLNGSDARVAIADGNRYTLQGNVVNPNTQFDPNTLLINQAAIDGRANNQQPFTVMNHARLVNHGAISLRGEGVTGIYAQYGATVDNRGDINILRNGRALFADGYPGAGDGKTLTEINNSGTLNLYSGQSTQQTTTFGAVSYHQLGRINQNGTINLYGDNVVGAKAFAGGRITLGVNSRVVFHDAQQIGYQAFDPGSRLIVNGSPVDVSSRNSTLYEIRNGAWLYNQGFGNVTLSGRDSTGIVVSGTDALVSSTDVYQVTGKGATVLRASDRAQGIITSLIALNGKNTLGAQASGDGTEVYAASLITGTGHNATAFDVSGDARLFNQQQGVVDLRGRNSTGARVHDGGNFINRGTVSVASGTGVDVSSGYGQYVPVDSTLRVNDGTAALRVGSGGAMKIYGDGQGASTLAAYGKADGLLLDSGAQRFEANDIIIGAYGSGTALNNRAGISDISLSNVRFEANGGTGIRSATSFDPAGSAQIHVGAGGTGYRFENADGSTTGNDLVIGRDYRIEVNGSGTGVRANTRGRVIAQGLIDIRDADGGSAIVTRSASQVINQGTIRSQSRVAPLIDLRGGETVFINQGTLDAPYADQVVVAGGATRDVVALLAGKVTGEVNTGNGSDTLLVTGGTLDGGLSMGDGSANQATVQAISLNQTRHITSGGADSTLNLSQLNARGGSFRQDDLTKGTNLGAGWSTLNFIDTQWTLSDNIKLAHSTINIDAGSTLFAGDGVNARLQGASNDSLVVNNAGTLDLTNGGNVAANTLTIEGSLASAQGRLKLNSTATHSDVLLVNGNASGTTWVDDRLQGGGLLDTNRDNVIAASEGVSLVQVTGSASADSFRLSNGYVAAGPWQYGLYSFAPGSSAGGNAWDYRLANNFICSDGSLCHPQAGSAVKAVRPAVTPQVPSWISAPVGLAYYSLAVTDDLHKRLGELRQQPADNAEMFIRYLGSDLQYRSNRGLDAWGYDFDLNYSAVQLGGNLLRADGAEDSVRGGVAYTRGNTRIRPHAADGYSSTSFDSDTLSLYGTWLRSSGWYVDGSLSWSDYRGETDIARQKAVAKPKGHGWTASVESGYPLMLAGDVRLEPQAQVSWLRMNMDSFTDADGARVSYNDYDQTIGRLGARVARSWQDSSQNQYTPYLRANYYRGWGGTAQVRVGASDSDLSQSFSSGKFGQMWDVGLGGTATLINNVALYAEADYRKEIAGNGVKGWRYNAGVRWSF